MANKENIEKLIAALESGKFKKGKDYLHILADGSKDFPVSQCNEFTQYCCLGVAECIMPGNKIKDYLTPDGSRSERYQAIAEWLGLEMIGKLATLNDESNTFEPVIDLLKTYVAQA